jgi:acetylornithine deacetylase
MPVSSYSSLAAIDTYLQQHADETRAEVVAAFQKLGLVAEKVPFPERIEEHPDYVAVPVPEGHERANVLVVRQGKGGGRSLILQTHFDVVPFSEGQRYELVHHPERGLIIYGRGSSDAKGQIATLLLAMGALQQASVATLGDVELQLVSEEEVGGNGAVAFIAQGRRADGVVVMEPSLGNIHPANRGALWFQIEIKGRSVHMGRMNEGIALIASLKEYEKELITASKGYRGFERYEHPVQLNIGILRGGHWPSAVPGEVLIEGGVGFLPNKPIDEVKADLCRIIATHPDEWIRTHTTIAFNKLRNDAFEIPYDHALPVTLKRVCDYAGLKSEVFGWNVSCDARLYAKSAQLPTVVFGPGDLATAHGPNEHIELRQIMEAARAIALFVQKWCGVG